jgi:hypothetical protein
MKYDKYDIKLLHCLKNFINFIHIKKIILWARCKKKALKFKTKNNYIKGYNKN